MDTNSKKYKTILADPPWRFASQRGRNSNRSAESHYDLMPLEAIKAMPIAELCEENAHLYGETGAFSRKAQRLTVAGTAGAFAPRNRQKCVSR